MATVWNTLIKRAPSQEEFSAWINGTGADTWSYSDSDFPKTIQPDTEYYVLIKETPTTGNTFTPDHKIIITNAEASGDLGIYDGAALGHYAWLKLKTDAASPDPDPQPVDPGNTDVTTPTTNTDSAPATTTKATTTSKATASNAKTADPVPYVAVVVLIAGVAAVSVVAIRRRRS